MTLREDVAHRRRDLGASPTGGRVPSMTRLLAQQHLSIRVPWHDTDWTGRVCAKPSENMACLRLERIRELPRLDRERCPPRVRASRP